MPIDPFSLAASATQFGVGALQTLLGGSAAKKAERALENLKTPTYTGSRGIKDYYNNALSRYNISPYQSAAYGQQQQQIGRNFNAGLGALQDRRSGLAGIGGLVAASNDASQRAGVIAENERNRRFGELGQATQMQNADDRMAFDVNQMLPFQKQSQLLAMKAGAANSRVNAGAQNLFGGLTNASMIIGNQVGGQSALPPPNVGSANPQWEVYMNQYRGRTGHSTWNPATALPYNDFKIPR